MNHCMFSHTEINYLIRTNSLYCYIKNRRWTFPFISMLMRELQSSVSNETFLLYVWVKHANFLAVTCINKACVCQALHTKETSLAFKWRTDRKKESEKRDVMCANVFEPVKKKVKSKRTKDSHLSSATRTSSPRLACVEKFHHKTSFLSNAIQLETI